MLFSRKEETIITPDPVTYGNRADNTFFFKNLQKSFKNMPYMNQVLKISLYSAPAYFGGKIYPFTLPDNFLKSKLI